MSRQLGRFVVLAVFLAGCSGDNKKSESNKSNVSKKNEKKERSEEEKQAIKLVEKLGGKVVYDITSDARPVFEINLADSEVKDADLVHLKAFTELETLNLMDTAVTDDGIMELANIKTLVEVRLAGSRVSVDGAKKLQEKLPDCTASRDR